MADRAFVSFNTNESARVKLTPAGIAECARQTRELNEVIISNGGQPFPIGPYADSEGYYCTSIWGLMNTFGHMMNLRQRELPFVDNRIEIELRPE